MTRTRPSRMLSGWRSGSTAGMQSNRRGTMTKSNLGRGFRAASAAMGIAAGVTLLTAGTAGAVGPHQHTITHVSQDGTVRTHDILNGFCNNPDVFAVGSPANKAVENFHFNIHVGPGGPEHHVSIAGGACAP